MSKTYTLLKVIWDSLKTDISSIKLWIGVLTGIVLTLQYTSQFLWFSMKIGQPVNVLEPFFYICNNFKTSMFIFPGLLLVLSDAPFAKSRTLQVICRITRRMWNVSVAAHIVLLALFYYGILLLFSIGIASLNGYIGTAWSIPMVEIAAGNQLAMVKYNLSFENYGYIAENSIAAAIMKSFCGVTLYGITEGLFLYTFNMNVKWEAGTVLAIIIHFSSYITFVEKMEKYSLLAYSMAIGEKTYAIFLLIAIVVYKIADIKCKYIDIQCIGEG